MVSHVAHACHKRGEGAHDGDEARQDDGFAAVLGVKLLGFLQMALFEDFGIGIGKQLLAKKLAYHEVDRITQNCGNDEQDHHQMDVHFAYGGDAACGKQQRIAWQQRHYHQAGFAEND